MGHTQDVNLLAHSPLWARGAARDRCKARTWNTGHGGQCSRARCGDSDFCGAHARGETWRTHGRVDGPIPIAKLREFLHASSSKKQEFQSTTAQEACVMQHGSM